MGKAWWDEISGEWTPPPPKAPDPKNPDAKARWAQWLPLVLSRAEVRALLAAPTSDDQEGLALRVLYASGMREQEFVALRREALEPATSTIRLVDRQVVVDAETFQELAALDWSKWSWTVERLRAVLVRAAQSCQVLERFQAIGRTLLPKALRNAFGGHCLENGMDLFSLRNLLGQPYVDVTEFMLELGIQRWRAGYEACHPLVLGAVRFELRPDEILRKDLGELVEGEPVLEDDDEEDEDELSVVHRKQADLSEAEVQMMLDGAERPGDRLILLVLYAAGLRVGELVNLLGADVEFDEARLFVRQSKELKIRYVLIDRRTAELLREWQNGRALAHPVFPGCDRTIRRMVVAVAEKTGILAKHNALGRTVSPHTLRHAFASHLYQRGMQLFALEKLMGHADLDTTQLYVNCGLPEWQKAYARSHELMR